MYDFTAGMAHLLRGVPRHPLAPRPFPAHGAIEGTPCRVEGDPRRHPLPSVL